MFYDVTQGLDVGVMTVGRSLLLCAALSTVVTGLPLTSSTSTPLPKKGPRREEFNETGTFLYKYPFQDQSLLCKKCSTKALSDSSYSSQQQPACIRQNYKQRNLKNLAPYCNVGEDLGCGRPTFNHTNSHLVCDLGYSNIIYTVYSTCSLVCNITQTTIGQLYCRESLKWHIDLMPIEDCRGPVIQDGHRIPILEIISIIGGAIFLGIIFLIICYCKGAKLTSRSPSPVQGTETPTTRNKKGGSIGECSLDPNDEVNNVYESSRLLVTMVDGPSPPQKVTIGTSTSPLNTDNENTGYVKEGKSSYGESQGEKSDLHESVESDILIGSRKSNCSDGDSNPSNKSVKLDCSRKSDDTAGDSDASSKKIGNSDTPFVKIFTEGSDTSSSSLGGGIDNTRIQEHYHSAKTGSDVYFVPSVIDVDSLVIERKDEGPKCRGKHHEVLRNWITLENVTKEDAGWYKWIITRKVDGITNTYNGVERLFVGEPCEHTVSPTPDQGVRRENTQTSTVTVPLNVSDRCNNGEQGQQINSVRLPPEGAESANHQVSGQVNPLNNGARPKVFLSGVHHTSTVVSGHPSRSVKDQPVARTLNYLNKPEKESENDLNQFDSPRNISSGDQNLKNVVSLENNLENDSVAFKEHVNFDSLLDSAERPSLNNSTESSDTNSQSIDCVVIESGMLSSENNADYGSKHSSENRNPSLISAPTLDPNSLLSTGKSSSNNNIPSGASSMGNKEQNLIRGENDSVELPYEIPGRSSTSHLHIEELLKGENSRDVLSGRAENRNTNARSSTSRERSLSHLNPNTINEGNSDLYRPDPSGSVEQSVYIEPRSDDGQTGVKVIYDPHAAVRGERAEDSAPHIYRPVAQVRDLTNEDVPRERNTDVESSIEGARVEIMREELSHTDEGAVGGIPNVDVEREERLANRCDDHFRCKTPLKELSDIKCVQDVCLHANPRNRGDLHSWFGLCLYYGEPRHKCEAICYARRSEILAGPMNYVMTDLLVRKGFTVGHIVSYFTQPSSQFPEIIDLLVNDCDDHKDCKYCKDLVHNNK